DPVAPPPPRQRLYANELGRLDLYHALCGAISSDPLCSTLSSGLRATAESRFADPALRPQIVAFTSSMDAPDIRNQAKEAQKFVKKIAKRLEKEKPLKDKVLKEIDKNLAPTDPLTIAFRALVESLTEEQLAELLRSILPSDEEQTAAMLDRARGAMMAILDAEAAEEARRRTGQLDAEWARAWIENHQRQSVGGVLRASALFLRAKNPPQPD
ncbi:hypothetical protein HYR69_01710, partial [Candidatus Sumerlaeota bacterium]|nr:hypothetical protein [Candidatus Sumerlaeota bacterium]